MYFKTTANEGELKEVINSYFNRNDFKHEIKSHREGFFIKSSKPIFKGLLSYGMDGSVFRRAGFYIARINIASILSKITEGISSVIWISLIILNFLDLYQINRYAKYGIILLSILPVIIEFILSITIYKTESTKFEDYLHSKLYSFSQIDKKDFDELLSDD